MRRALLIINVLILSLFFIFLFFNHLQNAKEKTMFQGQVMGETYSVPVRLMIPNIGVNATIQHVDIADNGEMDVPSNTIDVGWFSLGPQPGEKGSAVIAGHLNGEGGKVGVFTDLHKLKLGDKLYVENGVGKYSTFIVRESRTYDSKAVEEVFSSINGAHLNLITCDGVWDANKKSFSKRLVVFTDIVN